MKDLPLASTQNEQPPNIEDMTTEDNTSNENLTLIVDLMQQHETLQKDVLSLGNKFINDVQERVQEVDIQYLSGLKKFFTVYLDTVAKAEPTNSTTPTLATLLHTYFSAPGMLSPVAGTRHMKVQPTRRRNGISKGTKLAPSGRPLLVMILTVKQREAGMTILNVNRIYD